MMIVKELSFNTRKERAFFPHTQGELSSRTRFCHDDRERTLFSHTQRKALFPHMRKKGISLPTRKESSLSTHAPLMMIVKELYFHTRKESSLSTRAPLTIIVRELSFHTRKERVSLSTHAKKSSLCTHAKLH